MPCAGKAKGAKGLGTPEKDVVAQGNELTCRLGAHDACQLSHTQNIPLRILAQLKTGFDVPAHRESSGELCLPFSADLLQRAGKLPVQG